MSSNDTTKRAAIMLDHLIAPAPKVKRAKQNRAGKEKSEWQEVVPPGMMWVMLASVGPVGLLNQGMELCNKQLEAIGALLEIEKGFEGGGRGEV